MHGQHSEESDVTSQDTHTPSNGVTPVPQGPRRPSRRTVLLSSGTLVVLAATGAGLGAHGSLPWPSTAHAAAASAVRPAAPAPLPVAQVVGLGADGQVPWQDPLGLSVSGGRVESVTATAPDGVVVPGAVSPDGVWRSAGGLLPSSTYDLVATVRDAAGAERTLPVQAVTRAPDKSLSVQIVPGDGYVVGVGQAVSVRLGTPVTDPAKRAEVERRLSVTTTPAVEGSWRWTSSRELRYRGPEMWVPGTTIEVTAALDHVQAAPGVWGTTTRTSSFTVGDALTSTVDVQAHTMTVSKNGVVQKVMPASMGKPQFPTRNGTFVVLEKFASLVMDSATVDLPPGTPAYKTSVQDAVRLTNSGTFTHGAPWSVPSQGNANVSHGCVNLSPDDAHWYYLNAKRGDVVTVVGSTQGPSLSDAGSQDWNMSYDQWKAGSALAH